MSVSLTRRQEYGKMQPSMDAYCYSSTDWSWLAGLIDGEGSIGIRAETRNKGYNPWLSIEMVDSKTIERVAEITGNHIIFNRKRHRNRRDTNSLHFYGVRLEFILKHIYPYLQTKKDQAKYVLEFMGRRIIHKDHRPLKDGEIAQGEFFTNLLATLNKRGID